MIARDAKPLTRGTAWAVLLLCAAACGREPTSPAPRDVHVLSAVASKSKAPAGPGVSSAQPGFGDQGTTLDVAVLGSGFGTDAQATWLLQGVANGHVHTNRTTWVSSSKVVANITIDNAAQLALWDVQISTGGKNGVGSDVFEVTTAQVLSSQPVTYVEGTNNLGDVVGYTANRIRRSYSTMPPASSTLGPTRGGRSTQMGPSPLERQAPATRSRGRSSQEGRLLTCSSPQPPTVSGASRPAPPNGRRHAARRGRRRNGVEEQREQPAGGVAMEWIVVVGSDRVRLSRQLTRAFAHGERVG